MTVSTRGTAIDQAQVRLHENVHSFLSPDQSSLFAGVRADIRMGLYQRLHLFRYGEEAIAETTAQLGTRAMTGLSRRQAIYKGMAFPMNGHYGISKTGLLVEGAGGVIIVGGSIYGAYQLGQSVFDTHQR